MRVIKYNLINELSETLCEAVKFMSDNNSELMISDCIELCSAILKTLISEESSLKSNRLLLELKKLINILSIPGELDYDEICKTVQNIKSYCSTDILYKIKVAIVAELAGKWDAMESLYYALMNRDDCEVDVVLEPICNIFRAPDGSSKREIIYDDYLTSKGIKFYTCDKYHIEKVKPDITVISQPYESVTVLDFWPENIAKHSKLVYSPYFTALTLSEKVSTTAHSFFKLNTEKFAWKIACQSDKMKEHYKRMASNKGENVIVSGLPKWDSIINLNKSNVNISDTWRQKLENKTVFLWNTHFTQHKYGSQILTRGRKFLELFKDNKDIALIWRPHPMTDPVFNLRLSNDEMKEYKELLNIVEKSDNMILDKNSDYNEAFIWADALISDYSSMINQFLFMKKPVLLITMEEVEKARNIYNNKDKLFDFSRIPFASNIDEQYEFIKKICKDNKCYFDDIQYILDNYYSFADGKSGERFVDTFLNDFKNDFVFSENEKS